MPRWSFACSVSWTSSKSLPIPTFSDVQAGAILPLSDEEIQQALDTATAARQVAPLVHSVSGMCLRPAQLSGPLFPGISRLEGLDDMIWNRLISLIPFYPQRHAANCWRFWGRLEPFTELYLRLSNALQQLGHQPLAYCPLEPQGSQPGALLPREHSVIDVATIGALGQADSETLTAPGPPRTGRTASSLRFCRTDCRAGDSDGGSTL